MDDWTRSSVTSTSADVRTDVRLESKAVPLKAETTFRASHFFILASLLAATAAVIMSRQSTPEHLILISLTVASAGLAAAGFYRVLSPLVGEVAESSQEPLSQRERAVLDREKALTLRSLKELEFDRSMGKVSQADFDDMAGRLRARAIDLMKQLDESSSGYRTIIERELTTRLAAKAPDRVAKPTSPPAPIVAAGLCTCGTANDADARFCKRCGTRLGAAASADHEQPE